MEGKYNGYIALHRCLLDNPIWTNSTPEQKTILITLLLMVNHKESSWEWKGQKYSLKPGQTITSYNKISEACGKGITIQNVRTALARFKKLEFLTYESTHENTLITVVNWALYQGGYSKPNTPINTALTHDQHSPNTALTTNNNNNNDNNDNNKNNSNSQDNDTKIIAETWAKEFQQFLTPNQHTELRVYLDKGIQADTIAYAIKEAANQNVKNLAYVQGILNSYLSQGILTVGQAEQAKLDYANKKKGGQNGKHESDGKGHPKQDTGDKKFEFDASKFLAPDLSNVDIDMSDLR